MPSILKRVFFGVAPGTSMKSNPNALLSCSHNAIFTNVAQTPNGDVWWEGLTKEPPHHLIDWHGKPWTPSSPHTAAHPNSRFTAPAKQCPVIDPAWEDPAGVPIAALIFGGRRSSVVPLVYEALNWSHGTYIGCSVSSEMTAAAEGELGKLRHDPFAMLPFCGYNMADYFGHWLSMVKKTAPENLPRIFNVNWFRKGKDKTYLWPGFSENMRVLKWIFERTEGKENGQETPIGIIPKEGALDLEGLNLAPEQLKDLFAISSQEWIQEAQEMKNYLSQFGTRLPAGITEQLNQLTARLS